MRLGSTNTMGCINRDAVSSKQDYFYASTEGNMNIFKTGM